MIMGGTVLGPLDREMALALEHACPRYLLSSLGYSQIRFPNRNAVSACLRVKQNLSTMRASSICLSVMLNILSAFACITSYVSLFHIDCSLPLTYTQQLFSTPSVIILAPDVLTLLRCFPLLFVSINFHLQNTLRASRIDQMCSRPE